MGTIKTQKSKEMNILKKAHQMAEHFAVARTKQFLNTFLQNSGLGDVMFGYYNDIQFTWKKALVEAKIALEAANVKGDQLEKQRLQNDISDLEANIDDPLMSPEQYLEKLHDDLNLPFGGALALAYAMGYADRGNGATVKSVTASGRVFDTPLPKISDTPIPGIKISDGGEAPSPLLEQPPQAFIDKINEAPRIITDLNLIK